MVTRLFQLVVATFLFAFVNYTTASPFNLAASKCVGNVPGMTDVKNAFKENGQFCSFWLAGNRIRSPIPNVKPAAISSACKCITATATSVTKTIKSATPKPTACASKKDPFYAAVISDVAKPAPFCDFWLADPARFRTVVPGVGPQHLSSVCKCITSSTKASSSTIHATSTSTSTSHTTSTSHSTTVTPVPGVSSSSPSPTQTNTQSSSASSTSQTSSTSSSISSTTTTEASSVRSSSSSSSASSMASSDTSSLSSPASSSTSQDVSSSSSSSSSQSSGSDASTTSSSTSESASASATPKSDAAICPALSGDTLVDPSGTSYAMQCDKTYSGTVISGGTRKRQAAYTIENCLTACNGVSDCVAVSVLNGACTMLSDVSGQSSQSGGAAALNEVRAEAAGITASSIPSLDPPASSSSSTTEPPTQSSTSTDTISTTESSQSSRFVTTTSSEPNNESAEGTQVPVSQTSSDVTSSEILTASQSSSEDDSTDSQTTSLAIYTETLSATATEVAESSSSAAGADSSGSQTSSSASTTETIATTASEAAQSSTSSTEDDASDSQTSLQASATKTNTATEVAQSSSSPVEVDSSDSQTTSTMRATETSTATASDISQAPESLSSTSSDEPIGTATSSETQSTPGGSDSSTSSGGVSITSSSTQSDASSSTSEARSATETSSVFTSSTSTESSASPAPTQVNDNALGCSAPTAAVINGLPAAACGTDFDEAINDILGYYSADDNDVQSVEAAIIPGLPSVGTQKRDLSETIQKVAKDAISTILDAARSVVGNIVAALPSEVQTAEADVSDVSTSVAYDTPSQAQRVKRSLGSVHRPGTQWGFARRGVDMPFQPDFGTAGSAGTTVLSSSSSGTAPFSYFTSSAMVATGTAPTQATNSTSFQIIPTGTAPTQALNITSSISMTASVGTISPVPANKTTSAPQGTGTAVLPTSFMANHTSVLSSLSSALGTAPALTQSSNQSIPFPTGAVLPPTSITGASSGFVTVSRQPNATSSLPSASEATASPSQGLNQTTSVPLGTAPVTISTEIIQPSANQSVVLSTGGLQQTATTTLSIVTSSTRASNDSAIGPSGGFTSSSTAVVTATPSLAQNQTVPLLTGGLTVTSSARTTLPTSSLSSSTSSPSSSLPSPSSNATIPSSNTIDSAPITIMDTTNTLLLEPATDGSLLVSTKNADISSLGSFEWDKTNDVVFGDPSSRLLHYFPSEMSAVGASRFRLAGWGNIPTGASLLNLVPFKTDAAEDPVLVAVDSLGNYFWPFVCGLQGQTNKVFLVNDLANGASTLEGSDLVYTVIGGVAQNCAPLALTGNGMTGINV